MYQAFLHPLRNNNYGVRNQSIPDAFAKAKIWLSPCTLHEPRTARLPCWSRRGLKRQQQAGTSAALQGTPPNGRQHGCLESRDTPGQSS